MDIKRLKDNQIRCALTEEEIEEMGFCIDDIIGNGEITQKFMRVVLEKVEEQEDIDVDRLSPMVRAELLPDHSMTITFGGITEEEKKGMFGKLLEMMNQMSGKAQDSVSLSQQHTVDETADKFTEEIEGAALLALEFDGIDDAVRICKLFIEKAKIPQSSFYKLEEKYYLIMDYKGFTKEEMKPLVLMAVEYNHRCIAAPAGIAYMKEHGKCILAQEAISDLLQL